MKIQPVVTDMVLIEAGGFYLGSDENTPHAHPNEMPRRLVDLPDFCLDRYPVTNAQYAEFIQSQRLNPPSHWGGNKPPAAIANHPVTHVTLLEAQRYANWLSEKTKQKYRLPTEQEWEKGARGACPHTRPYVWGDEWEDGRCNTTEMGVGGTTAVDQFAQENCTPYGLVDMLGNVWEWTQSAYEPYPKSNHLSQTRGSYVVRGGCWDYGKEVARVSCRGRYGPNSQRPYLGFRLAAEPVYTLTSNILALLLEEHFTLDEMHGLCHRLGINKDNVPNKSGTLATFTREFSDYLVRHHSEAEFIKTVSQLRPAVNWGKTYSAGAPKV